MKLKSVPNKPNKPNYPNNNPDNPNNFFCNTIRDRKQIKFKFKREEKNNRRLIQEALNKSKYIGLLRLLRLLRLLELLRLLGLL